MDTRPKPVKTANVHRAQFRPFSMRNERRSQKQLPTRLEAVTDAIVLDSFTPINVTSPAHIARMPMRSIPAAVQMSAAACFTRRGGGVASTFRSNSAFGGAKGSLATTRDLADCPGILPVLAAAAVEPCPMREVSSGEEVRPS